MMIFRYTMRLDSSAAPPDVKDSALTLTFSYRHPMVSNSHLLKRAHPLHCPGALFFNDVFKHLIAESLLDEYDELFQTGTALERSAGVRVVIRSV